MYPRVSAMGPLRQYMRFRGPHRIRRTIGDIYVAMPDKPDIHVKRINKLILCNEVSFIYHVFYIEAIMRKKKSRIKRRYRKQNL